jgi:hypothetical protein
MSSRWRRFLPDALALALLFALWLLFFWRLITPIAADQASLKQGDFSGQFVTFAAYQYERLANGEIPLWNPYNNGGLPFIADTQAAVFYPPRLLTIALAYAGGGWSYHALELEMTVHVLAYSIMMYAFVRRLTLNQRGSILGGVVAALISGYGGFLSGYPPLQLALLEAAIWLPLGAIGLLEFARGERPRYGWLLLTGLALGLSWMAGHPQTSYFLSLCCTAYLAYLVYSKRWRWTVFLISSVIFAGIAFGLAAVQLLPGLEYLPQTARADLTYDDKGNGFPFQDIVQFIFPGVVSLFSPLYVGFMGLTLALIAAWRRLPQSGFWLIVLIFALVWSFGANSALYPLLYNILPGLRFFRGQERAAFLVANSLAILAGLGAAHLVSWDVARDYAAALRIRVTLRNVFLFVFAIAALIFVAWLGNGSAYGGIMPNIALGVLMVGVVYLVLTFLLGREHDPRWFWLIPLVIVFELFTVNMGATSNYDSVPPQDQLSLTPPALLAPILENSSSPFRVDGFRGLTDNYGSLYAIQDIHGISPLFLSSARSIIDRDFPNPQAWEVFAVRYVLSDWNELPVDSQIVANGVDRWGAVNLHDLENPRPFAQIMYDAGIAANDDAARAMLYDPAFNARNTVILEEETGLSLSGDTPQPATISEFAPEHIVIETNSALDGILSVALVDYPGWSATIDGQPIEIIRAYGALSAVSLPAGEHTVEFIYAPRSFQYGAVISTIAWLIVIVGGVTLIFASVRTWNGRKQRTTGLGSTS